MQVTGLLEILADHGGAMDVFDLDELTGYEFGTTLAVVKAAELLDFLDSPKNRVLLTTAGREYLHRTPETRKVFLAQKLLALPTMRWIVARLRESPDLEADGAELRSELAGHLPHAEPAAAQFRTIVAWGRTGRILRYDAARDRLHLVEQPAPGSA